MKIYLSPSAQPYNAYASGGTTEQIQCNRIASEAKQALERNGYIVKKAPEGQNYTRNVAESNSWGADLHIPIHTNAGGESKGTMGICYQGSVTNQYMQAIYQEVASATPWPDSGIVVRNDLYEISNTKMMCVYMECAFHDKKDSAQWIIDHVKELGEAIAKGVCKADGKKYISGDNPAQEPGNPENDMGLYYRAHCQTVGTLDPVHDGQTAGLTGYKKRLEGFWLDLRTLSKKLGVELRAKSKVHIQGKGWVNLGYITHETLCGSMNQSKRLEAIILEIEGLPASYELQYQVHCSKYGWTGWVSAGFAAGSAGFGIGIEAIKFRIVKKS